MEAELRKAPASYRMSMLTRVRNYNRDVEQLTADVVRYSVLVTYFTLHLYDSHFKLHFFIFGCVNIVNCVVLESVLFV